MSGAHPNVVKTAMHHSTITLTMDTYGRLFPGAEADAVDRLAGLFAPLLGPLAATGTDDLTTDGAQQSGREATRRGAESCDDRTRPAAKNKSRKPLRVTGLGDGVRSNATKSENSGGGTRTPDTRIMIPLL